VLPIADNMLIRNVSCQYNLLLLVRFTVNYTAVVRTDIIHESD
jgi:hypothetical protein